VSVALILLLTGVVALVVGLLILRSAGGGARLGRLLAGTTLVSIDEALHLARADADRYVRVSGRITSEEEFPDDQDRPLVFRRTRVQVADTAKSKNAWVDLLDEREAVPFAVETRSSAIAVDEAALTDGLVVIPRESIGEVADLPTDLRGDLPADTRPDQPARLLIEQLSAVEHSTICGVPVVRDGLAIMTAGQGRPLIVTTLDQPDAMRLLAHGNRGRVALSAVAMSVGLGLVAVGIVGFILGY
jgi:hypothetical protein